MATTPPTIIGLVGPSGSGKTTVSNYLKLKGFVRMHAVAKLKHGISEIFDVPLDWLEAPEIDQPRDILGGVSFRPIAEHVGDTFHRIAPLALPLVMSRRIERLDRLGHDRILVDGIRRSTEADVVKNLGGTVIRVIGDIDANKPCDITQAAVKADFELTWAPTAAQRRQRIDEILAQIGVTDNGGRAAA